MSTERILTTVLSWYLLELGCDTTQVCFRTERRVLNEVTSREHWPASCWGIEGIRLLFKPQGLEKYAEKALLAPAFCLRTAYCFSCSHILALHYFSNSRECPQTEESCLQLIWHRSAVCLLTGPLLSESAPVPCKNVCESRGDSLLPRGGKGSRACDSLGGAALPS